LQSVVDKKNRVLSNEALTDSSAKLTRGSDYYYNLLRDFYSVNSSSRVVDENGEPMQVYHGSDDDFDVFDKTKTHSNMDIQGSFFSPWELDASGYGSNTRSFFLNLRNPADAKQSYAALNRFEGQKDAGKQAREYLTKQGFDGSNIDGEEYIAFSSNQIKSATGNNGGFDMDDESILFQTAPDDYQPKAVGHGYKLFEQEISTGKLFPFFIGKDEETPMGKWLVADNIPTKGFSNRPGWHIGSTIPDAPWLKGYRGPDHPAGVYPSKRGNGFRRVWCEVSYPMDINYQKELDERGVKDIKDHVPEGGYYTFRETNGTWVISGALRVDRILGDDERQGIMKAAGYDEVKAFMDHPNTASKIARWNGSTLFEAAEDKRYMDAVNSGDMETAQRIVDNVALKKGYINDYDYRMMHQAPHSGNDMARTSTSSLILIQTWFRTTTGTTPIGTASGMRSEDTSRSKRYPR